MGRLTNRVVIVTGAASGIGAACARRFVEEGAQVVLGDLSPAVTEVAAALGVVAHAIVGDVATAEAAAALVRAAEERFGLADGLVCAAGLCPMTDFLAVSEEEFTRAQRVNMTGPLLLGQAVARRLVEAGKPGAIVNVTSTSARLAGPKQASYCATKAGLDGLTRAMAIALAPHGIRVNALAPGPTRTAQISGALATPEALKPLLARTPLGRMSEPEEQASVAAFLLSDDASFMTGESVYADGGRLALQYTMPPRE